MDQSVKTRKARILYIEDDPASRMLVDRTLRYAGYDVIVAQRGIEGIDIARSEQPDLIITDIDLPDISGRELTTMLRRDERFIKTPIVALTASGYGEQRDLAMAAGITGYITKPLDVEALPKQIEYYLGGGRDLIDKQRLSEAKTRYAQEIVARLESRIRELESVNKDLIRLDQMKDTFIQLTAHELRTPLTLVYGYSRLLQDSPQIRQMTENDENTQTLLNGLVEAIERMQNIINEILTISRIMTNQIDLAIGPINLPRMMSNVVRRYHGVTQSRKLSIVFDEDTWPNSIRADAEMIEIVLDNLISNAIKYTPDGGTINLSAELDGEMCVMRFTDTGIGVPKDEQDLIFERFHTGNDPQLHTTSKTAFAGGGLGLGLAICRGIVTAHGGKIFVESPGRDKDNPPGSTFIIHVPITPQSGKVRKMPFSLRG